MEVRLFAVVVNKDDTVRVESVAVLKETPAFYFIEKRRDFGGLKWDDPNRERREAFGFSDRIDKGRFETSARDAVRRYMTRRQHDKANALAVVGHATKQIASANELLMQLPPSTEA